MAEIERMFEMTLVICTALFVIVISQ